MARFASCNARLRGGPVRRSARIRRQVGLRFRTGQFARTCQGLLDGRIHSRPASLGASANHDQLLASGSTIKLAGIERRILDLDRLRMNVELEKPHQDIRLLLRVVDGTGGVQRLEEDRRSLRHLRRELAQTRGAITWILKAAGRDHRLRE